ncbi:MAG: TRAP transporter large permease subunit, partial [Dehalococcoidia bacterium]|nr:TRAP transporter large permease subunit [Dehalococcoidia bacterium]
MATLSGFLAVAMSLYQLLYISALFERLGIFIPRTVYLASSLGFVLVLVFLMYPVSKRVRPGKIPWYDIGFIILSLAGTGYIVYVWTTEAAFQYTYATTEGVILGLITTFLVLEATRRTVGWAMPIVVFIFRRYPAISKFLPGLLHGRGYSLERMMGHLYVSGEGIFGLPLGIAATIVVAYIIFAQFFNESGAGKFFINLANSMVGHFRGGPAKVAVIASALFGTLSGSPVGNVVSTGVITIPMMKKMGYPSHFAAAVEAVASNGGQIMPPVMG